MKHLIKNRNLTFEIDLSESKVEFPKIRTLRTMDLFQKA